MVSTDQINTLIINEVGGYQCMVAVAAGCRKALVNARWATVLLSCTNGPRNYSFHLVGAPFLTFLGSFQSGAALSGRRTLTIECLLISGCGQSHELVRTH